VFISVIGSLRKLPVPLHMRPLLQVADGASLSLALGGGAAIAALGAALVMTDPQKRWAAAVQLGNEAACHLSSGQGSRASSLPRMSMHHITRCSSP
jgi:hypothetical protein